MPAVHPKMYQTILCMLLFHPLSIPIHLVLQTRSLRLKEVKSSTRGHMVSGRAATHSRPLYSAGPL